jgi:hypothetical protein
MSKPPVICPTKLSTLSALALEASDRSGQSTESALAITWKGSLADVNTVSAHHLIRWVLARHG